MPKNDTCHDNFKRDLQTCRDKHQGAGGTVKCIREAKQARDRCNNTSGSNKKK